MNFEYSYLIKLALAFFAGLLIGLEREKEHKAAGLRTCIILCFTMCLAMIFNLRIFEEFGKVLDLIRLPAYAMTSISFLGIGVIRSSSKNEGVTTACTLLFLVVAGLGFGAGYYALNAGATLFAFLILKSKYLITDYINKQEKI